MIYRKKLIEVALPLEAINAASAREKSIRHGHPSTLHLWWARRPLAACRAVLFASLVDDPDSDPTYRRLDGSVDEERAGAKRAQLFNLITELVQWENSNNPRVINAARAEIASSIASRKIELGELKKDAIVFGANKGKTHPKGPVSGEGVTAWDVVILAARPEVVNAFLAEHAPPVLDPFCGGGSIPLEAQRLGLRAYASDLNPVAVLITKALIEIPPKFAGRPPVNPDWQRKKPQEKAMQTWSGAQGLAADVLYYGQWMRDEAEKRIGHLYPKVKITEEMARERPDLKEYVGEELTVIAWLWARTVASPNPACTGVHVPLVRSFWLSTKKSALAWVNPIVDTGSLSYRFEVRVGSGAPIAGTIGQGGDVCLLSKVPITREYIRAEGASGRIGSRLMAIAAEGRGGRVFLAPEEEHTRMAQMVRPPQDLLDVEITGDSRYLTPTTYGLRKYRDLFTARQLLALSTFSDCVQLTQAKILEEADGDREYADAVTTFLGLLLSKSADYWSNLCVWRSDPKNLAVGHVFARQALPMVWDFAESNPFSSSSGSWKSSLRWTELVLRRWTANDESRVTQKSALDVTPSLAPLVATDPPYYDNVPYADLSDFFYVWLRHSLRLVYPALFKTTLVPKLEELVADQFRHGGKEQARVFFERGMRKVFDRFRGLCIRDYPTTIYYAFRQAEEEEVTSSKDEPVAVARSSTGWETFLEGLVDTHWQIDGTWPVRTELGNRTRSVASNALASSIVLVCRPRTADAPQATRKQFIDFLRRELPDALRNLQRGNIAPVDLAQASIGPGMAIFTRFAKVMESDGSPMTVRTALGLINQALDEVLTEQEGEFDAATRWALAWFEQFGMEEGPFGTAETLSKAKNTAINGLVEAGIVKSRAGKVRLLKRDDLPSNWDPATDTRLTIWEITQHLIRTLDQQGESGAAALLRRLGGMAETARDLAYRLYSICERKKWADEALAYNGLVIAWPELTKLALAATSPAPTQSELF